MKQDQLFTILASFFLASLGWLVGYLNTIRRDRLSKRRDLRTKYLVEAYRRLEEAVNRNEADVDNVKALESAIADIQLLRSEKQAHLARGFALEFAENGRAALYSLRESLRAKLRGELGLSVLQ